MKLHFYFRSMLFIIITCCLSLPHLHAQAPVNGGFQMPEMSEADLLAMQEEINREIEKEVAKMSPDEQKMFYEVMENIETLAAEDPEMLERFIKGEMSKEEEESFVSAMVPEEVAVEKEVEKIEPEAKPKEEKKEKPKPQITAKQEKTIDIVNVIIKQTESFLAKMETIPEISLKVKQWSRKKKLSNWQTGFTWVSIRDEINALLAQFHKIKSGPATSDKLAYIKELSANESLLNNITQVKRTLDADVKQIIVSPFDLEPLDRKAKIAAQKTLSAYAEAIHVLDIPKALTDILAKYDPELKKQKEREETAVKEAEKAAKRPRSREQLRSAGTTDVARVHYRSQPSSGSYGSGYSPNYSSAPTSYGRNDYVSPPRSSRTPSRRQPSRSDSRSPKSIPEQKKDQKIEPSAKKSEMAFGGKTPSPTQKETPPAKKVEIDRHAQRQIDKVATILEDVSLAIDQSRYLSDIRTHLIDNSQAVDERLSKTTLREIEQSIELASNAIKSFSQRSNADTKRTAYKQALNSMYTKEFKAQLDKITEQTRTIDNLELKIKTTPEKRAAYLRDPLPTDDLTEEQQAIKQEGPGSIYEITRAIKELEKAIKDFA